MMPKTYTDMENRFTIDRVANNKSHKILMLYERL